MHYAYIMRRLTRYPSPLIYFILCRSTFNIVKPNPAVATRALLPPVLPQPPGKKTVKLLSKRIHQKY